LITSTIVILLKVSNFYYPLKEYAIDIYSCITMGVGATQWDLGAVDWWSMERSAATALVSGVHAVESDLGEAMMQGFAHLRG
jgi:hypothetical protein